MASFFAEYAEMLGYTEEVRHDLMLLIGLAFDSSTRQLVDAAWERGDGR